SVVFAMLASYFLSRTVVPVMARFLLKDEKQDDTLSRSNVFTWMDSHFNSMRDAYHRLLDAALQNRARVLAGFIAVYAAGFCLIPFVGEDFFPAVDGGTLRIHIIAPKGSRIEETERIFKQSEALIRTIIPADEIKVITQNIGLP